MKRLFWLAMGVTIGVLIMRRLGKLAEQLTPKNMAGNVGESLSDLAYSIRDFIGDVRDSMSEREHALRDGTGLNGPSGAAQ
jgi:hypothetical protein